MIVLRNKLWPRIHLGAYKKIIEATCHKIAATCDIVIVIVVEGNRYEMKKIDILTYFLSMHLISDVIYGSNHHSHSHPPQDLTYCFFRIYTLLLQH